MSAPKIRQLSQSIINKIAAGEVIERPGSVLKELLENSIDAGAGRVDVNIMQGGTELIRITDNGSGIRPEEIPLALSPHATSKIEDADDLFKVGTFGFRGEALASIAEISQMILRSRTGESDQGTEIRIDGGEFREPVPCGMPQGTSIEVRNLFFNTPVRRKYMRTITTEYGHLLEAFIRLVIPHPQIHFTFSHNEKLVHDLPAESRPIDRIAKLFGKDMADDLVYLESGRSEIGVSGFVSHPNRSRSNNRMQYFFLNSRHIRDRALQHALSEAYRGLLTVGRFPMAFLHLDMPPDQVDVNVHPAKMEVRFLDSNRVYSHFLGAIRERFLGMDLNARPTLGTPENAYSRPAAAARFARPEPAVSNFGGTQDFQRPEAAVDDSVYENVRKRITEWADGNATANPKPENREKPTAELNRLLAETHTEEPPPMQTHAIPKTEPILGDHSTEDHFSPTQTVQHDLLAPVPGVDVVLSLREMARTSSGRGVVQMHNRYLILETKNGIAIIDQHALHERLLYEQLKESVSKGSIDSQRLLVPIPVDLTPTEAACIAQNLDFLAQFGLGLDPFGGDTFLLNGYPAMLEKMNPLDILYALIEPLLSHGQKQDRAELLEEMLHKMACTAAVKMGDSLRPDAVVRLVELAEKEANAHHCPHGRPSMLVFTCEELNKMFKRSG